MATGLVCRKLLPAMRGRGVYTIVKPPWEEADLTVRRRRRTSRGKWCSASSYRHRARDWQHTPCKMLPFSRTMSFRGCPSLRDVDYCDFRTVSRSIERYLVIVRCYVIGLYDTVLLYTKPVHSRVLKKIGMCLFKTKNIKTLELIVAVNEEKYGSKGDQQWSSLGPLREQSQIKMIFGTCSWGIRFNYMYQPNRDNST
jgi:hypothetical protein